MDLAGKLEYKLLNSSASVVSNQKFQPNLESFSRENIFTLRVLTGKNLKKNLGK
jgi:hypothetical protein